MIATLVLASALVQGVARAPALPAQPVIANPASVYCVQKGGRVEIVTTKTGQIGICVLPDGRRIEEWTFFRASRRK